LRLPGGGCTRAARAVVHRPARTDDRHHRFDRIGQDDARQPAAAPLRRDRRGRARRWGRRARARPGTAVEPHRHRAAEALPVLGHGSLQPALRQPRRERRGAVGRARHRASARLRRGDARGARRAHRAGRHQRLGRAATTPGDRAGARQTPADLRLRRLLLGARHRHGRPPAAGARAGGGRRDGHRRRPARAHHPAGRPGRRARRRRGRGPRHPRGTARVVVRVPRDRREPAQCGGGGMSGATQAARPAPGRGPGGGPFGGAGMPVEKAMSFGPSAKRLIGRLRPERLRVIFVILLGTVGVILSVIGPKVLGEATNLIFEGVISSQLPDGVSKDEVIAGLEAEDQHTLADMLRGMQLHPGEGIDFSALAIVLGSVLLLYVFSSVFMWLQGYVLNGITQRTVLRLRRDVEEKVHRLPLTYFDRMLRGELLSRVTNDIDNVSQSLQQTLSQLLTSLLTVLGVLLMMFVISPVLALVAIVAIPITLAITVLVAKRAQKLFVAQWTHTGALN